MRLAGKNIIVTGASSGIGAAQAALLAQEGARILAVGRNQERLDAVVRGIREQGGVARAHIASIESAEQVSGLVQAALDAYGGVDVLCNTSGVFDNYAKSLDITEEFWQRVFDVNVKGVFLLCNAVLPHMLKQGKGAIVTVASIAGLAGGAGGAAYTSAKHAVVGYVKQLCVDYAGQGIRANAICPGSVATPLIQKSLEDPAWRAKRLARIPAGRLGTPEDIASLTVFLASDESAWINGAAISIDGGRFAWS